MSLEEALKLAGRECKAITLFRSGERWQASVSIDGAQGWRVEIRDDAAEALAAALASLKLKRRRDASDLVG